MSKQPKGVPDFSAVESCERYQEVLDREAMKNGKKKSRLASSDERYRANFDKIVWEDLDAKKEDVDDSSEVSENKPQSDNT